MGFKRTTEGRVFFQGSEDTANDAAAEQMRPQSPLLQQNTQQTQLQILALLKSLNDRLKATQAERNYMRKQLDEYRLLIEDLEQKAEQNERAYGQLEQKLSVKGAASGGVDGHTESLIRDTIREMEETRKLLLDIEDKADRADRNVSSLQKLQQDQMEKMARTTASYAQIAKRVKENEERQLDLSGKVEETMSQQARLSRKVDKAVEDRARFMRKIERIEETVIQTRDALNAKAMVLLTDQATAALSGMDDGGDQTLGEALLRQSATPQDASTYMTPEALYDKPSRVAQYAVIGGVIAVALVAAGWFFMQNSGLNSSSRALQQDTAAFAAPPPPFAGTAATQTGSAARDWTIENDASAFSGQAPAEASAQESAAPVLDGVDDIGTLDLNDEAELLRLLEGNPDALASALNDIEPGFSGEEAVRQASLTPADQAARPAAQPVQTQEESNYVPPKAASTIEPDTGLPDVIKDVQEQALAGSAEAQHDLAAIYTAGHAGVQQDYGRAAYWFRRAAEQGIANARYNLGVLHHQGLGVKANLDEAVYWYKGAAALGHPEAQYNLGIAYIEGIGVPYNARQAATYFEQAADGGVMEAAYNLGLIYENGLLGGAQPDLALMWYKQAADQGSPEAKAALEQLARALNIKLEDVNRIVEGMRPSKQGQAQPQTQSPPAVRRAPATSNENRLASAASVQPASAARVSGERVTRASVAVEEEFEQIMIAQVQEQLMAKGLYPGPADGRNGPQTSDAIRSYQSENNLPVSGKPTVELLSHMLARGESVANVR